MVLSSWSTAVYSPCLSQTHNHNPLFFFPKLLLEPLYFFFLFQQLTAPARLRPNLPHFAIQSSSLSARPNSFQVSQLLILNTAARANCMVSVKRCKTHRLTYTFLFLSFIFKTTPYKEAH
ncbi:hypothetical protein ACOSQ2_017061 [Xanthoceras sorbifolium]